MTDSLWILAVRLAGGFHFVTLTLACFTPIPPDWERNLATLPPVHRRFAIAQNFSIGAMIAVLGLFSLGFAPHFGPRHRDFAKAGMKRSKAQAAILVKRFSLSLKPKNFLWLSRPRFIAFCGNPIRRVLGLT